MEPVLFAALVFLGVILIFASMLMGQALDPVQARLQQIAVRPRTLEELELQRPLSERTLKPIIRGLSGLVSRFYPANTVKGLALKLKRAGMESTSTEFFLGVKGFASIVGAIGVSSIVNLITSDLTMTILGLVGGLPKIPTIQPMRLFRIAKPFDHPDWIFELKYDGFRGLAYIQQGRAELVSRNGHTFRKYD